MKKLLILTNPESLNLKLLYDNNYVQDNYEIIEINHFDILQLTKEEIITSTRTILLSKIDLIWFEFDWDLNDPNRNTHHFSKLLYTYHGNKFVYNAKTLQLFHPFFDSKLFNAAFLDYHNLPHPNTQSISAQSDLDSIRYPKVLKKDMSGRARSVQLVRSRQDLTMLCDDHSYVIQDLIDVKTEMRVVVLGTKVIGAVDRSTKFNGFDTGKVKVLGQTKIISNDAITVSQKVAKYLQSDLVGLDIVIDADDKAWVIEFNIGASLKEFIKHTGIDIIMKLFQNAEIHNHL